MSNVNNVKYTILKSGVKNNTAEKEEHKAKRKSTSQHLVKEIELQPQEENAQSETVKPSIPTNSRECQPAQNKYFYNNLTDNISQNESFASADSCEQYEDAKSTTELTKTP